MGERATGAEDVRGFRQLVAVSSWTITAMPLYSVTASGYRQSVAYRIPCMLLRYG